MKKNIKLIFKLFILILSFFTINGCGEKKTNHKIIPFNKGEDIVINIMEINDSATYYNYHVDDKVIQIFAVKASDSTIRILFNTCASCNPSPDSYFIQEGDYFICQTCKNKYHKDSIGLENKNGCSPIAILDDNKEINKTSITIKSEFIETYKSKFENINIYKK